MASPSFIRATTSFAFPNFNRNALRTTTMEPPEATKGGVPNGRILAPDLPIEAFRDSRQVDRIARSGRLILSTPAASVRLLHQRGARGLRLRVRSKCRRHR